MPFSLLNDRGVIVISGDDRHSFLQGLITNDIVKASTEEAVFAALLSPQGKFLHDFFILEYENTLLLETDKAGIPDLIKRLMMYRLRSKVDMAEMPEWKIGVEWEGTELQKPESRAAHDPILYKDPRIPELGNRLLFRTSVPPDSPLSSGYDQHRYHLGIPEGSRDLTFNRSLPMEWGYDKLNAISFTKGCYVGQEVTARSKHRATLHKGVYKVEAKTALPPHDTAVMAGGKEVGSMAGSQDNTGLALIQNEAIKADGELKAGNIVITAELPEWMKPTKC